MGRVYKAYHPTRCNPPTTNCGEATWGVTTYTYDALGRVTLATKPDGSTVSSSYSGNCATVTDEAGHPTTSCTDALGRMTNVTDAAGNATNYSYNALDDLTQVTQGSQTRTFVYDSLSRLTSATNPESGTTTYAYDANGNLTSKTAPKPNQTSPSVTVTTTYNYDALNRLTQKTYSDGTSEANFFYDVAPPPHGPPGPACRSLTPRDGWFLPVPTPRPILAQAPRRPSPTATIRWVTLAIFGSVHPTIVRGRSGTRRTRTTWAGM